MKLRIALILCTILLPGQFTTAEPLPVAEQNALMKQLLPQPKSVKLTNGPDVVLDKTLTLNIELGVEDTEAKNTAAAIFKRYFGTEPTINVTKKDGVPKEKEAYKISATEKTLTLSASDFAGIRYAFSTLRQLATPNHDTNRVTAYLLPELEIDDAPAMTFRGIHLCWFPETRFARVEQAVRLAAYYKFNYVVIEFWGTFPSVRHPEIYWEEFKAQPEDIKRLIKIGKELGVTLIPQFNIFGHASGSRSGTLKNVVLDRNPEFQPLFETDGWTWCLSNPAARLVLTDILLEMYEMFDKPPYFHIGCDEANPPECRQCLRADYKALFKGHLLYFHKLFSERNCRIMMWHDMLISGADPRWKGYVANANKFTVGIAEELPKDIVICDWQYYKSGEEKNEIWATMRYFKGLGFTVLACPWDDMPGIRSQGRTVADAKLDGMLCTTWDQLSKNSMYKIFSMGGQVTWHAAPDYPGIGTGMFGRHLRQIGWDIPVTEYRNTGHTDRQIPPETVQGR
ncbi:hypothetical protein FACS189443_5290 [Planctomycetales bacterium]|nr:hypothetical protein FACS189443_5290 [Planctomycetales bacterium]